MGCMSVTQRGQRGGYLCNVTIYGIAAYGVAVFIYLLEFTCYRTQLFICHIAACGYVSICIILVINQVWKKNIVVAAGVGMAVVSCIKLGWLQ